MTVTRKIPRGEAEPRWPAYVAAAAVGTILAALPADFLPASWRVGLFATVLVFLIPTVVAHRWEHHNTNRIMGLILNCVITVTLVALVVYFVMRKHDLDPFDLLWSGAVLWWTNVLVFALWYWRIDAGGPHARDRRAEHEEGAAFLFPQMTIVKGSALYDKTWKPQFVDYLFLSFNTSTAFSPTDVPVLGRQAKALMMLQSFIALALVVVLVATAVNRG